MSSVVGQDVVSRDKRQISIQYRKYCKYIKPD